MRDRSGYTTYVNLFDVGPDPFMVQAERELHSVETCTPPCPFNCPCECHLPIQIEEE